MNKEFQNFINTRKKKDKCECNRGETWCDKCVSFGEEVSVELPDGTVSKGFYRTNYKG
jgi:hypothetical protein